MRVVPARLTFRAPMVPLGTKREYCLEWELEEGDLVLLWNAEVACPAVITFVDDLCWATPKWELLHELSLRCKCGKCGTYTKPEAQG